MSEGRLLPCPGCGLAVVAEADGVDRPCPSCGAAVRVEAPPEVKVPGLATSFLYPFRSMGSVLFLCLMAPIWGFVRLVGMGMIFGLGEALFGMGGILMGVLGMALVGGYISVWLWEILDSSAQGGDRPPATPWPGEYWEFGKPFVRFVAAFGTAFLPAILARTFLGDSQDWRGAVCGLLALAGMAYYPISMLLVGFSGSWTGAFRLPTAFRSMRILGGDYALCCVFIAVSFGLSTAAEYGAHASYRSFGTPVALFVSMVAVLLEVAIFAVHMRAIGLVYRAHQRDLGWFR